ncbi:MAG: bifunctional adenosylcobinamide kinase/adenosylcobinamide-phosphate guanylyltransferase [Verrucomicrobiota bacterium]
MITLITGGARSGKSRHALELAMKYKKRVFIATAESMDKEMDERIARHKAERGDAFTTIEEPLNPAEALKKIPAGTEVALIDCLTLWTGNLMHKHGEDTDSFKEADQFLSALDSLQCDIIIVTNEVGMGIVPDNSFARKYRDVAGRINQRVAARADKVTLVVCGVPVTVKAPGGLS